MGVWVLEDGDSCHKTGKIDRSSHTRIGFTIVSFPQIFPPNPRTHIFLPHAYHMSFLSHSSRYDYPNNTRWSKSHVTQMKHVGIYWNNKKFTQSQNAKIKKFLTRPTFIIIVGEERDLHQRKFEHSLGCFKTPQVAVHLYTERCRLRRWPWVSPVCASASCISVLLDVPGEINQWVTSLVIWVATTL